MWAVTNADTNLKKIKTHKSNETELFHKTELFIVK